MHSGRRRIGETGVSVGTPNFVTDAEVEPTAYRLLRGSVRVAPVGSSSGVEFGWRCVTVASAVSHVGSYASIGPMPRCYVSDNASSVWQANGPCIAMTVAAESGACS